MLPLAHTRREAFNTEVEPFVQCFTNYIFEIRSLEVEFQSEINRHLCAGSIALGHRMNEPETPAANTPYNQIAGQSVERLAAISDGIFAVAMTLLVLDLHDLPDSTPVLLGQHIASRSRPLLELAVCEQNRFGKGRHTCRGAKGSRASHPGGPGALCAGSLTVRG
jgi:Endosomal/lysosomal potassium channel TMEM175